MLYSTMQRYLFSLLLFLLAMGTSPLLAQQSAQHETSVVLEQRDVYLFGISQNLADTVVYMSEVCEVKGAQWGKNKFLLHRDAYAHQFRQYVERSQGRSLQTSAVVVAPTRQQAEKQLVKTFKKLNEQKVAGRKLIVRMVPRSDFQFSLFAVAR